jgi:hypothetical protein
VVVEDLVVVVVEVDVVPTKVGVPSGGNILF